MKPFAAAVPLLLCAGLASAQTPPDPRAIPATAEDQAAQRRNAEQQIELLNRQLAALTQIVNQNQRGLVVYPISLALPGPINCQGNCIAAVTAICNAVRYPKAFVYPAVVPSGVVGDYVNGICTGL